MHSLGKEIKLVPAPVLTELFFVSTARVGYDRAVLIDSEVRKFFNIIPLAIEDMERMEAIKALAERLKISRVFTFDRRDFTVYRPVHADALTLLP